MGAYRRSHGAGRFSGENGFDPAMGSPGFVSVVAAGIVAIERARLPGQSHGCDRSLIAQKQSSDGSWRGFAFVRPPLEAVIWCTFAARLWRVMSFRRARRVRRAYSQGPPVALASAGGASLRTFLPTSRVKVDGAEPKAIERAAAEVRGCSGRMAAGRKPGSYRATPGTGWRCGASPGRRSPQPLFISVERVSCWPARTGRLMA